MNPTNLNHRFTRSRISFLVFTMPSTAADPAKCVFHDPTRRQDLKCLLVVFSFDDFKVKAQGLSDKLDQAVRF